ncbi:MAG: hypothetical protein ACRECX_03180 [Methyloceanibacter sp.]|uniref:hypothetical protein n=1 Tax=Methyloceanibacter sp. TaxID=1965321 RepID=UPI003D6C88B7
MPTNKSEYRGYEIRLRREWSNWCAKILPTRSDLPIIAQSPLHTLSLHRDGALKAAKSDIDDALSGIERHVA